MVSSETGQIFWVPSAGSIVDANGLPNAAMAEFEIKLKDATDLVFFVIALIKLF